MNILIIEDEILAVRRLEKLLRGLEANIDVQFVFEESLDSISGAVEYFVQCSAEKSFPDAVFMDIQLSDGVSFDIAKHVRIEAPVIFTTAYNEYALQAFHLHSVDYLLKPIQEQHLERAVRKLLELRTVYGGGASSFASVINPQFENLLKTLAHTAQQQQPSTKQYKSRFLVETKQGYMPVSVEQTAYIVSEHKISWLITTDNKRYSVDATLEELESVLNPEHFFRANRQCIVHIRAVVSVHNAANGKLTVNLLPPSPNEMTVGREKAAPFKEWLMK